MTETKTKFKAGDIVRGIGDKYTITNRNMTRGRVICAYPRNFKVKILKHETMPEEVGETYPNLDYEDFELVESGPEPEDLLSVEETWQWIKEHYRDEHFGRLFGEGTRIDEISKTFEEVRQMISEHEVERKMYNGKVICLDAKSYDYTTGKIYQFEDGAIIDNSGLMMPGDRRVHSFEEWKRWSNAEWMEVVE